MLYYFSTLSNYEFVENGGEHVGNINGYQMFECKSCGNETDQLGMFCSSCGAKLVSERLTIRRLSSELLKLITNLETPFLHTTKSLILNTKEVTFGYIGGKRKVISSPIRFATIALTVYGVFQFVFQDFVTEISKTGFLNSFIQGMVQGAETEGAGFIETIIHKHYQFASLFVAPFIAFLCLKFNDPPIHNYAEHLSISIYAVSLSLLLSSSLGILLGAFSSELIIHVYTNISMLINWFAVILVLKKSYDMPIISAVGFFLSSYLLVTVILILVIASVS